jgi:hypothetical protein
MAISAAERSFVPEWSTRNWFCFSCRFGAFTLAPKLMTRCVVVNPYAPPLLLFEVRSPDVNRCIITPPMADHKHKRAKTDSDKEAFVGIFPKLLDELVADIEALYPDFDKGAIQWFKTVSLQCKSCLNIAVFRVQLSWGQDEPWPQCSGHLSPSQGTSCCLGKGPKFEITITLSGGRGVPSFGLVHRVGNLSA